MFDHIIESFFNGQNLHLIPDGVSLFEQFTSEINTKENCSSCLKKRIRRKYKQILEDKLRCKK